MTRIVSLSGVFVLAACGSIESGADASPGDDGSLGPDAADTSGEASIEIVLEGSPAAGLKVAFHDPTGAVVAETTTDSSGRASAVIDPDSMVSVALSDVRLVTVFDIQPLDSLLFSTEAPREFSDIGSVTITSSDTLDSGHYWRYEVGSNNFSTENTGPLDRTLTLVEQALDDEGRFDVIVIEYDESDRPDSSGVVLDVTPDPDGSTTVDVPTPFDTATPDLSISISEAPADASSLFFQSYNRIDGQYTAPSWFQGKPESVAIAGGSAAASIPYIGVGDVEAVVRLPLSGSVELAWARRRPRPAPALALGADDLPPRLTAAIDAATPARPRLSWTADGDRASGDAMVARLDWSTVGSSYAWIGFAPPDADGVQVPRIPESWAAAPRDSSSVDGGSVAYLDLESHGGYSEFRGRIQLQSDFELVPDNRSHEILPEGETGFVYSEVGASGAE